MAGPPIPVAARRPVTDRRFGDDRVDEYAWLRDRDDPAVLEYLTEENDYARSVLEPTAELERRLYDEIVARIEETDVTAPVRFGPWWYYARTFEGASYPVHCRRPWTEPGDYPDAVADGDEQVVLDENALAEGHDYTSVGVLELSVDHRLAALGVDFEGNERHDVTFLALDGATPPAESIADVGYGLCWTSDSKAVLYVRVDAAWRPFELWRHDLGTDPSADVLLHREDDERFRVEVGRTRDGAAILVHLASTSTTEVAALDPTDPGELRVLWARRQGVECSIDHLTAPDGQGWWVATTNDGDATDFQVMAARDDDGSAFRTIVPWRAGRRIDAAEAFAGHLVVSGRSGGDATVRILPLREGADPFGDDLDALGYDVAADESPATTFLGLSPEFDTTSIRVLQTSLVSPPTDLDVDLATGSRVVRKRKAVRGGYDPGAYCSARLMVRARDGVEVPVSIVHRRDLLDAGATAGAAPAEPAPLLLYGYGAYEISSDPTFSSARLPLLDRGVIYAIAHVRGGGELGRTWYEAGRLQHKATTFYDFVDVARGLVDRGFTKPGRLGAYGASAGGLLIGAAINEAPDAFGAVVAQVPFVDVLNTILDPSLPLTVGEWEEWGDPVHDEAAYRWIKSWSPYDNVTGHDPDGTARVYPELLVLGSLNDTRVSYWEPAKWVARLRAANPQNAIAFRTDLGAGHAGPSGRYDAWRERAMIWAFVLDRLGAAT